MFWLSRGRVKETMRNLQRYKNADKETGVQCLTSECSPVRVCRVKRNILLVQTIGNEKPRFSSSTSDSPSMRCYNKQVAYYSLCLVDLVSTLLHLKHGMLNT